MPGEMPKRETPQSYLERFEIKKVSPKEADKVLSEVRIPGDPFFGKSLTPEILKEQGLAPKHKVVIDNQQISA